MNIEELRDGIFSLRTRRFGTVAELMIKMIIKSDWGKHISHDLYDPELNDRIEVKFSTALKSNDQKIKQINVLDQIIQAVNKNRMFTQAEWEKYSFDCNIQQVKKHEFDMLYYGIFFSDVIEIFRITPDQIDGEINYSNKQHAGNKDEGQFHLNNRTYVYHKSHFFFKEINYSDLWYILEGH